MNIEAALGRIRSLPEPMRGAAYALIRRERLHPSNWTDPVGFISRVADEAEVLLCQTPKAGGRRTGVEWREQ